MANKRVRDDRRRTRRAAQAGTAADRAGRRAAALQRRLAALADRPRPCRPAALQRAQPAADRAAGPQGDARRRLPGLAGPGVLRQARRDVAHPRVGAVPAIEEEAAGLARRRRDRGGSAADVLSPRGGVQRHAGRAAAAAGRARAAGSAVRRGDRATAWRGRPGRCSSSPASSATTSSTRRSSAGHGGSCDPTAKRVTINCEQAVNAQVDVLCHELAHVLVRVDRHDDDPTAGLRRRGARRRVRRFLACKARNRRGGWAERA